jgi:hypothetical protein
VTAASLQSCWSAIKAAPDPWAPVWRDLTARQRRMLLTVAGAPLFLSGEDWRGLPEATRDGIRTHAPRLVDALRRVIPEPLQGRPS